MAILFLSVWTCGTCCQHEMMWPIGDFLDLGSPVPISPPPYANDLYFCTTTVPLFSSLFFKEPIVEPFCLGNATIVGASLETKTRPYHLSDRKRWTRACVCVRKRNERAAGMKEKSIRKCNQGIVF